MSAIIRFVHCSFHSSSNLFLAQINTSSCLCDETNLKQDLFATGFKTCGTGEGIIVAPDRLSGQLKSTSPGRYWLPYFVYTVCRCRRGCWFILIFFVVTGVEDIFCVFRHLHRPEPSSRPALRRLPPGCRCKRGLPRLNLHNCLHRHPRIRRRSAGLEVRLYPLEEQIP